MRLGVIGSRANPPQLGAVISRIRTLSAELGLELLFDPVSLTAAGEGSVALPERLEGIDVVMTLGGDGTLLRGAGLAGPRGVPVIGCNLGKLGFLTAAPADRLEAMLQSLVSGAYVEERRLALEVEAAGRTWWAANDAVVHSAGPARLLTMRVRVDGDAVGQYSADGIIVCSATGSTAYSLSAGGPILVPSLDAIVAAPICPHTLAIRPLVVGGDARIEVDVLSRTEGTRVTVDGDAGGELGGGDRVVVRRSEHPLRLIRFPEDSFFSVLRRKLRWGDVRPEEE